MSAEPVDPELVRRMTSALRHRGPDECGVHVDTDFGFGVQRLSIIDLVTGSQPISNEDGRVWVAMNGEIYNFPELRTELESLGHRFRSRSDTEVVVHGYEEWGLACLSRLRGMFALAVWDKCHRKLVLARDRLGEKPLYYVQARGGVAFASELKALLRDPDLKPEIDILSVHRYLCLNRVPAPHSIFCKVFKLPPGHVLVCSDGRLTLERYWSLSFVDKTHLSERDCRDELDRLLEESVRIRMRSDAPLGAFLSGGVDSSTVVAMMRRITSGPIQTFTIGSADPSWDESNFARTVAQRFETDHHEFIVTPDVADVLPILSWHFDEPFADPSAIPTYYLSKQARECVKVALTGDAGDEVFGGYEWYLGLKAARYLGRLPRTLLRGAAWGLRHVESFWPVHRGRRTASRMARLASASLQAPDLLSALEQLTAGFTEQGLLACLYTPEMRDQVRTSNPFAERRAVANGFDGEDPIERVMFVQLATLLPDVFFTKVDIASMANSLECRSVFADHLLVEFAASVPMRMKIKGWQPKYLLRQVAGSLLPAEVIDRPKRGFSLPLSSWLRGPLSGMLRDCLLDPTATGRGYFERRAVRQLVAEHLSGKRDHGMRLWTLLMLEQWHRTHVEAVT